MRTKPNHETHSPKIHYLSSKVTKGSEREINERQISTQYSDKLYDTEQVVEVRIAIQNDIKNVCMCVCGYFLCK